MSRTTNLNNKPPLGTLIGKRLKEIGKQQKWLAQEARLSKTYLCAASTVVLSRHWLLSNRLQSRLALTLLIWSRPYWARNLRDFDLVNENFPVCIA